MMNIVVVGGGAGGLELATSLGRKLGKKNKDGTITRITADAVEVVQGCDVPTTVVITTAPKPVVETAVNAAE